MHATKSEASVNHPKPEAVSSYTQILKSTSIIGGASGLNYVIGLLRTKAIAILLGPSGVGAVSMFLAISTTISSLAGLGITSSGVREIAKASGSGDKLQIARIAIAIRRISWITGLAGWALTALLAFPISLGVFGDSSRTLEIALLGASILLGNISGAQAALIQGMRRVGDIARIQLAVATINTIVAITIYLFIGQRGIIPVLVANAATQMVVSWSFSRRIKLQEVHQSWNDTLGEAKPLIALGVAFMLSGLVGSLSLLGIQAAIMNKLGFDANGIYQAAWSISGMFAGFILSAMGTDYYPRLAAVAHLPKEMNRLVNEQTEIGLLLAVPGLLASLTFAPWIIQTLYSKAFIESAELLPWMVLGVLGQVISWPLGYILIAKGEGKWFAITELAGQAVRYLLAITLMSKFGLVGTAIAQPLLYVLYTIVLLVVAHKLIDFTWSIQALRLLLSLGALVIACLFTTITTEGNAQLIYGGLITLTGALICFKGLTKRASFKKLH